MDITGPRAGPRGAPGLTGGVAAIDIGSAIDLFSRAALAVRPDVPFDHLTFAVLDGELEESPVGGNAAVDEFLAYMKKSLAERMADAWLAAHGLDRAKLKAMKPEEREAVLKRMAEELKQQLQEATRAARGARETEAA